MAADVSVFGAPYSTYVRAVRMALEEKGVAYELDPVGIIAEDEPPASHYARQPFGKIPAFEHAGFGLYETTAITHYIDEAFDGPALMPGTPKGNARVNQVISIIDGYAYKAMVWDVFVESVFAPQMGGATNPETVAAGLAAAETCMSALDEIIGEGDYLAGPNLSLADLQAYPDFFYFRMVPAGAAALESHPKLNAWMARMDARASAQATVPPEE